MPTQRIKLPISGMTCATCAYRVEQALAIAEGVTDIYVNRTPAYASVRYDPTQTNLISLVKRVYNEGYGVSQTTIELPIVGVVDDTGFSTLEDVVRRQRGVLSVKANPTTENIHITFVSGMVQRTDIVTVIEQAGYSVLDESEPPENAVVDNIQHNWLILTAGVFSRSLFRKFLNRSPLE